jgi:hypothetical protein
MVNTEFYKNAKIYKIVDNTNGNIYVGSTCKKLCQRLAHHRSDYKRYLEGKYHYISSFNILENNEYDIILLENVENCKSKEHLRARERYYIESLNCVNKRIEGRTKKDYYIDNKEIIIQTQKEYYNDHKTSKLIYQKSYYNKNKEEIKSKKETKFTCCCGGYYSNNNKSRHMKSKLHQEFINMNPII